MSLVVEPRLQLGVHDILAGVQRVAPADQEAHGTGQGEEQQPLPAEQLEKVAADTMVGGATLTKLLGTSAWMAPGAAAAQVVSSVLHDSKKLISCSALLDGEYGEKDLCIGVPCILGRNGIEKIVEFELTDAEMDLFRASAQAVRKTNGALSC